MFSDVQHLSRISKEDSYNSQDIVKSFMKLAKPLYEKQVAPGTLLPKTVGNMYTAALYGGLASLVSTQAENLANRRILMFSYGSGLASSMFSLRVANTEQARKQLSQMASILNLDQRLSQCVSADPKSFTETMLVRENLHKSGAFDPQAPVDTLAPGTFYLVKKDDKGRRFYDRRPAAVRSRL
eukprot:GABV01002902.1.p1 GENE.GABV01002902.1~~GABV01002902.1.p1  ORF type:complete len:192 (+),score=47.14 GABV01002902.1:29-577(+)